MVTSSEKTSVFRTLCVAAGTGLAVGAVSAMLLLGGCGASDSTTSDQTGGTDEAATTEPAAQDAQVSEEAPAFVPDEWIDENGLWKNVKALDYVTLPEYAGVEVPAEAIAVSDDEVQAQIDSILAGYTTVEQVTDRAVENGDTINIDYVGSIDGVEFDGGSTQGMGTTVTIGVTQYIDDFLEQLIGHKPGENFDIEVTFPDDYHATELAGKDAVFNITINYIAQDVTPEATDEFVKENLEQLYGWTTVDDMRDEIIAGLSSQKLDAYVQGIVFDGAQVSEVPQSLIDYQEASMIDYYTQLANSYGMGVDEMLNMVAGVSSVDEMVENSRDQNEESARNNLIVQAIAEDAGLAVSDEDVEAYFASMMGVTDITPYVEQYGMSYLKLVTLSDSVIDYLSTNAVVLEAADQADEEAGADEAESEKAEATEAQAEETADADKADEDADADAAADATDEPADAEASDADKADADSK